MGAISQRLEAKVIGKQRWGDGANCVFSLWRETRSHREGPSRWHREWDRVFGMPPLTAGGERGSYASASGLYSRYGSDGIRFMT